MPADNTQLDAKTIDVAPPDSVVIDDGLLIVSGDSDKLVAADPAPATADLVG